LYAVAKSFFTSVVVVRLPTGLPPVGNRISTTKVPTRPSNSTQQQTIANPKQHAASTHIPCGSQAYVPEEAHGICAVALPVLRFHTA
jgi:hypothetical protein